MAVTASDTSLITVSLSMSAVLTRLLLWASSCFWGRKFSI